MEKTTELRTRSTGVCGYVGHGDGARRTEKEGSTVSVESPAILTLPRLLLFAGQ